MLRALCLLGMLAGCDEIFRVDRVGVRTPADAVDATDGPGLDTALPEGLVAWFEMEDISSGMVIDTAGNHDGTCISSSCPTVVTGRVGNGFLFDGTSAVIHAPSGGDLDVPSDLTVAMWVRVDSAPAGSDYGCVFNKLYGTDTENSWQFCMSAGEARWDVFLRSTLIPGSAIDVGVWQHMAFTWSSTTDHVVEYVNGSLFGEYSATTLFDSGGLRIGADTDAGSDVWFFNGALDELRIYKRALSSAEIADLLK